MSDIPGHDHWKTLAELLGAEVSEQPAPPFPVQEPVAAPSPASETPRALRRTEKPPAPKREKHWGWLANELGLAAPPGPEPVQEELQPKAPAEPVAIAASQELDVSTGPSATPQPEPSGPSESVPPVLAETGSSDPLEVTSTNFVEEVATAFELTAADDEGANESAADVGEGEPPARRRRRRGRRHRREETDETLATDAEEKTPDADDSLDVTSHETAETEPEQAADADESRPRRRRRKRRRPPQENRDEAAPAGEVAETDHADDDELDEEDHELDDEEDDEAASGEGVRPKHRRIPSWGEAMDHIISNNMASRSRSPGGGPRHKGRK